MLGIMDVALAPVSALLNGETFVNGSAELLASFNELSAKWDRLSAQFWNVNSQSDTCRSLACECRNEIVDPLALRDTSSKDELTLWNAQIKLIEKEKETIAFVCNTSFQ